MCVTHRAHLADPHLIRAFLDRTEFVKHDNAIFSVCWQRILQTEQSFIPVVTCNMGLTRKYEFPSKQGTGNPKLQPTCLICAILSLAANLRALVWG